MNYAQLFQCIYLLYCDYMTHSFMPKTLEFLLILNAYYTVQFHIMNNNILRTIKTKENFVENQFLPLEY